MVTVLTIKLNVLFVYSPNKKLRGLAWVNLSTLQMIYFTVVFKIKGPDLILIYFWLLYLNNHFSTLFGKVLLSDRCVNGQISVVLRSRLPAKIKV